MVKIVVGCGENKNVILPQKALSKNDDIEIELAYSDEELIFAMENDTVDAVVRGSLKSSKILKNIKDLNKGMSVNRASFIRFNNEIHEDNIDLDYNGFLLGPVGIDEGNTIDEKFQLTLQSIKFLLKLNKIPKIAVLAGGRKEDFGRSHEIDKSIKDSEILVKKINDFFSDKESNSNYNAIFNFNSSKNDLNTIYANLNKLSIKNYYILIEEAIADKNNIIIAPDGIMGNIIFRTLVLINSWESFGAIALGSEKIFIDTSRDQSEEGYLRALTFAYDLANK
jgi:predicted methyltransferase MtxX (methanogen marker protein 4)